MATDLTTNTNSAQSLYRLTQYLRGLLKTLAGEDSDPYQNMDPDYDGTGFGAVDLKELTELLEALGDPKVGGYPGTEGREDWALERESEISRLEKENQELRRMLGIDEGTMAETGVTLDLDRMESGRYATFLAAARRQSSIDGFPSRPSYWENNGQSQSQSQPQSQIPNRSQTPPLQRPMELQPGMRTGPQGRRTGIFGAGQQRGGFIGGTGRGVSIGLGSPGTPSVWNNQPLSPAPPQERPWQLQGGPGMDLNR